MFGSFLNNWFHWKLELRYGYKIPWLMWNCESKNLELQKYCNMCYNLITSLHKCLTLIEIISMAITLLFTDLFSKNKQESKRLQDKCTQWTQGRQKTTCSGYRLHIVWP